jgi:hypothetical protein
MMSHKDKGFFGYAPKGNHPKRSDIFDKVVEVKAHDYTFNVEPPQPPVSDFEVCTVIDLDWERERLDDKIKWPGGKDDGDEG